MSAAYDAVLLIAFGGPTAMHEVRPFLQNVARGRPIPPERLELVAHHYELIGGRSPLNELTLRQAQALETALRGTGMALPVYVGMRNWTPYLHETLARMAEATAGAAPSASSCRRSRTKRVGGAISAMSPQRANKSAPLHRRSTLPANGTRIRCSSRRSADCVQTGLNHIPTERRAARRWCSRRTVFRLAMAAGRRTSHRSKMPPRRSPQSLGTPTGRSPIRAAAAIHVTRGWSRTSARSWSSWRRRCCATSLWRPIGFVCDHVEVLYDLDIEARQVAETAGINFVRASTVNDHPAFIRMLADIVGEQVRSS